MLQFLGQSMPTSMDAVLTVEQISAAGISNPDDFACFQMEMHDPASGAPLGTGTDCLIFHAIPGQVVNAKGLQNGVRFKTWRAMLQ